MSTLSTRISHYLSSLAPKFALSRYARLLRDAQADILRLEKTEKLYYELLYTVQKKFPKESRHETALRYLKNAESTKRSKPSKSRK